MKYLTLDIITERWREPSEFYTTVYNNFREDGVRLIAISPEPEMYGEIACDRAGAVYRLRGNKWHVLKMRMDPNGYMTVQARVRGTVITTKAHIIVARTFIPNPMNKSDVDHINRIRSDNRVENLRWMTRGENTGTRGMFVRTDNNIPGSNRKEYMKLIVRIRNMIADYYNEYPNYIDNAGGTDWRVERERLNKRGTWLVDDKTVPVANREEYTRVAMEIRRMIEDYYIEYPNN